MIYIIGIFIAFFLALIILTKKGRSLADIIMGIWMIVIGIHLASYYGFITEIIYQYPVLLGWNVPIPFFHGIFLYLYVEALTEPNNFKSKKWLFHFMTPAIVILLYSPFYILSDTEKLTVFKNEGKGYETIMALTGALLNISGILYIFITNRLLQRHKRRILNQFSNQEKINLNWLRFLAYAMCVMWILIIVVQNDTLIFSSASIFVVFIGYFGIKQVGIFTNQYNEIPVNQPITEALVEDFSDDLSTERKKYAKSGLNEDSAKNLHQRLKYLMDNKKIFTEPELTLSDLATRLEIHPNYLSQVINEMEGVNFYDYINSLRINEFKRLVSLPENQKYTLLALAFDCGFNSKSSFNRFFKKATGIAPSEYLKQMSEK